jgi:Pyridoxamine 5'-phosphate oxidase
VSIPVDLAELAGHVVVRGFGYLLTVGDDGRPHAVALRPDVDGATLRFAAGGRTGSNAAARPDVAVVFPPHEGDDFSLVVDGTATVEGSTVVVVARSAVRHRPAP